MHAYAPAPAPAHEPGGRPHTHEHPHVHEHAFAEGGWAPSRPGSVALDIGPGVGALMVLVPGELAGRELEVEYAGGSRPGPGIHTAVRERLLPGGTVLAAVFQALGAAEYDLRVRGAAGPAGGVLASATVAEGQVTEIDLVEPLHAGDLIGVDPNSMTEPA